MLLHNSNETDPGYEVMTTARGKAEWQEVDRRLREYAQHRSALDAAEVFDLVRAEQLKIYVSFGFVTLYEYMERVLGYKPHAARERMRVGPRTRPIRTCDLAWCVSSCHRRSTRSGGKPA